MMLLRTFIVLSAALLWTLSFAGGDESKKGGAMQSDDVHDDILPDTDRDVAPEAIDMPTCLLCVCLSGSVYCEEVSPEMSQVPALPKETAYLYSRFNKITKINNNDFADTTTLKRIDLSWNLITEIEDGAFSRLANLEELNLSENRLTKLPALPARLMTFNANFNKLTTQGVKSTAFKKLTRLSYLYLGNNELTAVPHLPESLCIVHLHNNKIKTITDETFCQGNSSYYIRSNLNEVRLEGNPIQLWKHPYSFICLHSLPIGWYN
ncbi:mimecan-like [Festucalex cinctus]